MLHVYRLYLYSSVYDRDSCTQRLRDEKRMVVLHSRTFPPCFSSPVSHILHDIFRKIMEHLHGWSYDRSQELQAWFRFHCVSVAPKSCASLVTIAMEITAWKYSQPRSNFLQEQQGRNQKDGQDLKRKVDKGTMWSIIKGRSVHVKRGVNGGEGVHQSVYLEAKVWGERPIMACASVS